MVWVVLTPPPSKKKSSPYLGVSLCFGEKVVANRLQTHMIYLKLIYLIHYNQPTGHIILQNQLPKVHNDIIISMDQGEVTALELA